MIMIGGNIRKLFVSSSSTKSTGTTSILSQFMSLSLSSPSPSPSPSPKSSLTTIFSINNSNTHSSSNAPMMCCQRRFLSSSSVMPLPTSLQRRKYHHSLSLLSSVSTSPPLIASSLPPLITRFRISPKSRSSIMRSMTFSSVAVAPVDDDNIDDDQDDDEQQQQRNSTRLETLRQKLKEEEEDGSSIVQVWNNNKSDRTTTETAAAAAATSATSSSCSSSSSSSREEEEEEQQQLLLNELIKQINLMPDITPSSEEQILKDSYDRVHTYLRISLVERCNLRCLYCMPPEGVPLQQKTKLLTSDEILLLTKQFVSLGVNKIRLTGGEPLLRPDIVSLVKGISNISRDNNDSIKQIGMTTNGITLKRKLDDLLDAGLTHVNISLDTLDPTKFEYITRRNAFQKVYDSIMYTSEKFHSLGIHDKGRIKINCVVMKDFNDDEIVDFINFTSSLHNVDIRFIEYMPFTDNGWNTSKFVSYKEMLTSVNNKATTTNKHNNFNLIPLQNNDNKNDTTKWYTTSSINNNNTNNNSTNTTTTSSPTNRIGFITSMSSNFCSTCNRLRLTADGQIKVCLFDGLSNISLRDVIRTYPIEQNSSENDDNLQLLQKVVYYALKKKKYSLGGHKNPQGIANANDNNRPMTLIGG